MNQPSLDTYTKWVAEAGAFHGGICGGISIGTRMTMIGLQRIGISDPKGADRKKLMVFVEIDRCFTDAIMVLTGCRPGKRTMKICNYGKMAATFINLETGRAVRVASRKKEADGNGEPLDFATADAEQLFFINDVKVSLRPEDMPGPPVRRVACDRCGESIMDCRDIVDRGRTLCRPCYAQEDYYHVE